MTVPKKSVPLDAVASLLAERGPLQLSGRGGSAPLPAAVVKIVRAAVAHLCAGDQVSVVALRREVTTGEAARILGISLFVRIL